MITDAAIQHHTKGVTRGLDLSDRGLVHARIDHRGEDERKDWFHHANEQVESATGVAHQHSLV